MWEETDPVTGVDKLVQVNQSYIPLSYRVCEPRVLRSGSGAVLCEPGGLRSGAVRAVLCEAKGEVYASSRPVSSDVGCKLPRSMGNRSHDSGF